jgi:hypothetical protein
MSASAARGRRHAKGARRSRVVNRLLTFPKRSRTKSFAHRVHNCDHLSRICEATEIRFDS